MSQTPHTPWLLTVAIKVVLFDLWKTIARGPYPEPIANFRSMLGLNGKVDDEEFLRVCLTTQHEDPSLYMQAIATHFGVTSIPENALDDFQSLIRKEKNGLLTYTDVIRTLTALKRQGYRLGMVTNSWPFPVRALLESDGLDQFFDHVIASSEVGMAKQDGPEIYILAAHLFGVSPEECVMVGDNPALDVLPALKASARAVLIDRDESYVNGDGSFKNAELGKLGIRVIRSLDELLNALS